MVTWRTDPVRARRAILVGGGLLLLVLAAIAYLRGVDRVEVLGGLLFIPVFLAFAWRGVVGGLVGGAAAAVAYLLLRIPTIRTVGIEPLLDVLLIRAASYPAFGAVGGWAMQQVDASLHKLLRVDRIDDLTGLHTARFLVEQVDLERSRAQRYGSRFSVVVVELTAEALGRLDGDGRDRLLHDLGQMVDDAVRQVDRGVYAADGSSHRFAVVLPETDAGGAAVLGDRLAQRARRHLQELGVAAADAAVSWRSATFPGSEEVLDGLRAEFAALDPAGEARTAGSVGA